MSIDPTANQLEPRRCENCGARVVGRFSPCPVCHSLGLEGSAAHAGQVPGLYVTRQASPQEARARRPARGIWHPSPETLVYPYDSIDETEFVAKAKRRSRGRIVLATSVLAVSSAVYLVAIHGDDLGAGATAEATHDVSAQQGEPSIASAAAGTIGAQREPPRQVGRAQGQQQHPQQQRAVAEQRVASVRSSPVPPVTQPAASPPVQRQAGPAASESTRVAVARPTSAEEKSHVDARPGVIAQQRPAGVAQSIASAPPAQVTPLAALPPAQREAVPAPPDSARVAAAQRTGPEEKLHVEARPGVTAQQRTGVVAQNLASGQPASVTPAAALPLAQRPAVPAPPDPARVAVAQRTSPEEKLHVDARPSVTAQQQSAVVAQNLASGQPAPVTPAAALAPAQQREAVPAPPESARVAVAQRTNPEEKLRVEARPNVTAQQQTAVVAQTLASVRPAPATPLVASSPVQRQAGPAPADSTRVTAARSINPEEKSQVETRPGVTAQQQTAVVTQNLASVRPAPVTPLAAAPLVQRQVVPAPPDPTRVAAVQPTQNLASVRPAVVTPPAAAPAAPRRAGLTTPDATRATAPQSISAEDKRRADAATYLREARASMKANNLSAAKAHLAAAIAAQPNNREARRLRATVHTLEQQRDALLNLARSCGYIGHLACTSRDAGIALQIDSSSAAARRLATRAMRESELRIEPPAEAVTEAVAAPLPPMRYVSTHH